MTFEIGQKFVKNYPPELAGWCNANGCTIEEKDGYYEVVAIPAPSLDELKQEKLNKAGAIFAEKRDRVRFIDCAESCYGFDCANEDIVNFMAAWKAAELTGSTAYKVWLTENTKGLVVLSVKDFQEVFDAVRASQLADYAWYEEKRTAIQEAQTVEELEAIEL